MTGSMPLSTIIALARAGALDHAWAQFCAAGHDRAGEDPAALTVKGRLLKDHALRATDEGSRRRYYLQSAECYRASAALQPATYPLINAATLSLLSGDRPRAEEIAREVLERIAREPDEPETPYYKAATEAEALLLLGRRDEARATLEAAVAAAPLAWEDHASTLRQFQVIEDALGGEKAWLDLLRPLRSLHFAVDKDTGPKPGDTAADVVGVGFGFGALAAGAELLTAEALLAGGAQLHVVLASDPEHFAARFVDPFGGDWRERFDAALAAAESVRCVRPLDRAPDAVAVALADGIAHGAALLNAERLMGEAVHAHPPGTAALPGLALLAIRVDDSGSGFEAQLGEVRDALAAAGAPALAPYLAGETVLIGYPDCGAAAAAARSVHAQLRDRLPAQIAAHYGLIDLVRDPFSAAVRPAGSGVEIAEAIAGASPPGSICVSDDFAAVHAVGGGQSEANWIGEIQAFDGGPAIGLYALKPIADS
ncbi:MAG TPA: tetratricopeptide repeat-containing protein [Allosphingosinicella sp.]|nr:tetratricopeptide repeat-containing protein [Allosphingosinicella sp.]